MKQKRAWLSGRLTTFLMVVFLASTLVLPKMSVGAEDMTTIYVQESEVPIEVDGNITRAEWGNTQEIKCLIEGIKTVDQEAFFRVQHHKDNLIFACELLTDSTPQRGDGFNVALKTGADPKLPESRADYVVSISVSGTYFSRIRFNIAHIPEYLPFKELVKGGCMFGTSWAHNASEHMNYELSIPFKLLSYGLKEDPSITLSRVSVFDQSVPVQTEGRLSNFLVWPMRPEFAKLVFPHPIPQFIPDAVPIVAAFCLCCVLVALAKSKRSITNRESARILA